MDLGKNNYAKLASKLTFSYFFLGGIFYEPVYVPVEILMIHPGTPVKMEEIKVAGKFKNSHMGNKCIQ